MRRLLLLSIVVGWLLNPVTVRADAIQKLTFIFASNMPEIGAVNNGSYPKLASLLEKSRLEDELTLFVFGGGSLGPSPLSSLDRGSHIIDILNTLEPDLMSIGKREFSYFEDELTLRSYEAAFPFIGSNLYDPLTKGNLEGVNTTLLIDKGDLRIGFISILDEEVVEEYLLQRTQVNEPKLLINQYIEQLNQQGAELIVLIYGKERDYYPALLDSHQIDFAIRSTAVTANQESLPSRVFAISDNRPALMLKVSWPQQHPKDLNIEQAELDLTRYPPNSATALLIDEYNIRLHRLLNQRIGRLTQPMNTHRRVVRTQESEFGNFVADSIKDATGAEIALVNGGVIRGDRVYQANTVLTRGDIVRELPFRTHLAQLTLSGSQLWQALENGVSEVGGAKGRFPQVSGMQVQYSAVQPAGKRLQSVVVNGQPLDLKKMYVLATSDYLLKGGDGYTMFLDGQNISVTNSNTPLLSDVVIRAIQNQQNIGPVLESRIVRTDTP